MSLIQILDEPTINQIAAGEVVERPSAVLKELIENAMDSGATAITAEIKEGGLSLIRITDNGAGIAKGDIPTAFLRHATSKIRTAEDLLSVTSLGFRGEALSSIAAVSQVELITKTPDALLGYRYIIEGGEEKSMEEIGCPGGTTIIVRNLFFNTPARRKFLKSPTSEASYISDLMERLIISHPDISFKYIVGNQVKLQSSGNNNSKDILYHIYGRDISKELLPIEQCCEDIKVTGYIGKPVITRGNRNFENYFINGRYIKSSIITKAIEEAYKPYLMQHKYPFTSLYFEINPSLMDVNVHPQKLEIRLKNGEEVYHFTQSVIREQLSRKEMIPKVSLTKQKETSKNIRILPEPFEKNRRKQLIQPDRNVSKETNGVLQKEQSENETNENTQLYEEKRPSISTQGIDPVVQETSTYPANLEQRSNQNSNIPTSPNSYTQKPMSTIDEKSTKEKDNKQQDAPLEQLNLFERSKASEDSPFLSKKGVQEHRIIGQVFSTYWLVEYKKELYIIDQHAAHEKVLYEKIILAAQEKTYKSQLLLPPIVLSLTLREQEVLHKYKEVLVQLGYEIEHFGQNEFSVRAVPADLYGLSEKELLLEFMDDLSEDSVGNTPNSILERIASLSCKSAIKANHMFSFEEAEALIKELLQLENPYHCPHGRPVIISMSQYELEKKFKRIL